jgi:O-succinylbenzoic acid--CoA ligase
VLVGGGPVPPALVERARGVGVPVLLTYGLTEACSQVTTERPGEADGRTAGVPLPGLEVRIDGEEGAIAVRGPTLMRGYLDDDAATAAVLRGGWLHTGDIGRLDGRGRLTVLARRTDLILSGGENVYPAEVEAVLAAHPGVAEVAVVARPDARWGQVPVAVVVPRAAASLEDLRGWARARLAGFKVPAAVVAVDALPRTAAGKVDRAAVQATVTAPSGPCSFEKTEAL